MRIGSRLAGELLASEREQSSPVCVGEIAEVADADEASGQHMLAEAAQELACGESHDALLIAVCIVFPSEAYAVTIEAEQALIADGDAVGVAAKIAQHAWDRRKQAWHRPPSLALATRARVLKEVGSTLTEHALEESEILAAEDAAQHLDGRKKAYLG